MFHKSYVHSRLLCEPERMLHTRVLNQFALAQANGKRSGPGHKEATCTFHIYLTKRSKPEQTTAAILVQQSGSCSSNTIQLGAGVFMSSNQHRNSEMSNL